ncbi:MAG: LysR family transcriptional regulator [Formivibrio sp.]|nr:LysR family transcriptional regulator [Formivibrio sp.]
MIGDFPATTLEQWVVLQTVINEGSFAKAAERLHRSQSSISYALSGLQAHLGMELLHIVGRKAELTDAGKLMLAQSQPLVANFLRLESHAQGLKAGERTSLSLIVDSVFPKNLLFGGLKIFQQQFPHVLVHVSEVLRSESEQSLARKDADLYIIALSPEIAVVGNFLMDIDFVAVAHSDYPLHLLESPLSTVQLDQYPLVVIADRALQRTQMHRMNSMWSFSTFEAAIEAICHGVGYGWLPRERIRHLLESGVLKRLQVASQQVRKTPLYLVFGNETLCYDQTVAALARLLREQVANDRQGNSVLDKNRTAGDIE